MSNSADRRQEFQQRQRARLLYSFRDFQAARCAAAFLAECEPEKTYPLMEMRRFRCYETTMVVAYARPFLASRGQIPSLSLKMAGVELTDEQTELHNRLLVVRNKVFAHSDTDMMRTLSKGEPLAALSDDFGHLFDEGLEFIGPTLQKLRNLIEVVYGGVFVLLMQGGAEPSPALPCCPAPPTLSE